MGALDPTEIAQQQIRTLYELEARTEAQLTTLERVSGRVAGVASTAGFVIAHVVVFAAWVIVNLFATRPIDPFPFTFLTFLCSLEAILLTSFVLIRQAHMERLSHRRAELDLHINLLTETELTKLLQATEAIARHLGIRADPEVSALAQETDVAALAAALDREREQDLPPGDPLSRSAEL
jgi:uncharacterized membrane protein